MKQLLRIFSFCLLLAFCFALAGCGETDGSSVPQASSQELSGPLQRKIVQEVELEFLSEDIDTLKNAIAQKSRTLGGYAEETDEDYSDGECTFVYVVYRIPTQYLDEFVLNVEGLGTVENKSSHAKDVTADYIRASAQRDALAEKKEQLETMLKYSNLSAADEISLIDKIANVSAELRAIEIALEDYDAQVGYATVTVIINEPVYFFPDVFVPLLIILAIPLTPGIIVLLLVWVNKRRKKKEAIK